MYLGSSAPWGSENLTSSTCWAWLPPHMPKTLAGQAHGQLLSMGPIQWPLGLGQELEEAAASAHDGPLGSDAAFQRRAPPGRRGMPGAQLLRHAALGPGGVAHGGRPAGLGPRCWGGATSGRRLLPRARVGVPLRGAWHGHGFGCGRRVGSDAGGSLPWTSGNGVDEWWMWGMAAAPLWGTAALNLVAGR